MYEYKLQRKYLIRKLSLRETFTYGGIFHLLLRNLKVISNILHKLNTNFFLKIEEAITLI